ncbi:MAG: M17 family peptidase N-terminal domain-containing protein, partial [Myxococcaceae bacterium]
MQGVDTLCLFIGEDERPLTGLAGFVDWRLCGALSRVLVDRFFTGAPGDQLLFPTEGRFPMMRIFVVGLGQGAKLGGEGLAKALAGAAQMLNKARVESVAIEVPGAGVIDDPSRAKALQKSFLAELLAPRVAVVADKGLRPLVPGAGKH